MDEKSKTKPRPFTQYASLPYRFAGNGQIEFALITSRDTGRWVLPKGWPMRGKKPHAAAAREALEEAGLVGQVERRAIGSYDYEKRLRNGLVVDCHVEVYPLAVTDQRKSWREKGQRTLSWLSPGEAADAVAEPELGGLLREAERVLAPKAKVA